MASATQEHGEQRTAVANGSNAASELLERVLLLPVGQRQKAINDAIERRIEKVADVLPASLKDQAARFVKRAEITFSRTAGDVQKDIYTCTPESIVRCVIEAAEIGLSIDGKLCYAVPYNRKIGTKQKPSWQRDCQLQIDYKGLIVVARRSGQIKDAWAREVRDNDVFSHEVSDGVCHLNHTWDARQPRGETFCAYAIIQFSDGSWRYELMDIGELQTIRQRSKSKDFGPWITDTGQMYCKTVLRRILKLYCDDPAVGMALEIDEREFSEDLHPIAATPQSRVRTSSVMERLAPQAARAVEPDEAYQPGPDDEIAGGYEPEEVEAQA